MATSKLLHSQRMTNMRHQWLHQVLTFSQPKNGQTCSSHTPLCRWGSCPSLISCTGCFNWLDIFEMLASGTSADFFRQYAHQIQALCWLICLVTVSSSSGVIFGGKGMANKKWLFQLQPYSHSTKFPLWRLNLRSLAFYAFLLSVDGFIEVRSYLGSWAHSKTRKGPKGISISLSWGYQGVQEGWLHLAGQQNPRIRICSVREQPLD